MFGRYSFKNLTLLQKFAYGEFVYAIQYSILNEKIFIPLKENLTILLKMIIMYHF